MQIASQAAKNVSINENSPENRINQGNDNSPEGDLSEEIPPSGRGKYAVGLSESDPDVSYYTLYQRQKLLTNLALKLSSHQNHNEIIEEGLGILGSHTGISRAYLFEDKSDGIFTSNTYEWCNSGIPSHKHLYKALSYELFPSLKRLMVEEGLVNLSENKQIPDDLKEIFLNSDIKSVILFPVYIDSEYCGFLGFDDCINAREWAAGEIALYKTASQIFSGALERKIISRKLEDSELRLMLALQIPMEGLWDWNTSTGYVNFSDTWCQMLGYEPNCMEPNVASWRNLVHPDDIAGATDKLEQHLCNQTPYYESVHRIKSRDGNWKWILDRGVTVKRDNSGRPLRVIGIHTDISVQKQTEEELKKSVDVRNKLFSIIAHDLRGHISNFLPALNIISDKEVEDDDFKTEILQGLKKASFNTFNLLENLLNWARYQTDKISLKKSVFNINDLVAHNIDLFESYLVQKSIAVSFEPCNVYHVAADKESVNLIVRNLISNATKFTPRGGKIALCLSEKSGNIHLTIQDSGLGIPEEIQKNLFNKDIIHSTYGTDKEKGAGLGLMLCKEFADLNGGDIYVESIPGIGSSFTVRLKAAENQNAADNQAIKSNQTDKDLTSKRILIVEDEEFNLFFIKSLMKEWKLDYTVSENGEAALGLLQNETFDLILLDLEMPVMDGYTFLNQLRESIDRPVAVFAMSANNDREAIEKAYAAGADDFIIKPYQADLLYDKIVKALSKSNAEITEECRKKRPALHQDKKWSDISRLQKTLGDDEKMVKMMIQKFLEITPTYYTDITEAYKRGDYTAVKSTSHKIKSSIELLAEKNIVTNIRLINQYAASDADIPKLKPLIRFFTESFPLLCKELNAKLNEK